MYLDYYSIIININKKLKKIILENRIPIIFDFICEEIYLYNF